jgi:hypothetical protein
MHNYSDGGAASPGQGSNSQLGPVRPTALPSGHIFASFVHATGSPSGGAGQGANSQLGPVRPTELPSGHIMASIVHAVCVGPVPCLAHAASESVVSRVSKASEQARGSSMIGSLHDSLNEARRAQPLRRRSVTTGNG